MPGWASLQIHPNITSTSCIFVHRKQLPGHSLFRYTVCHSQFDLWPRKETIWWNTNVHVPRPRPALSVLKWSAAGDSRQKDTGGFWQTGRWWGDPFTVTSRLSLPVSDHISHQTAASATASPQSWLLPTFSLPQTSLQPSMLAKVRRQPMFLMSVTKKDRKKEKEKCYFQGDVRAYNLSPYSFTSLFTSLCLWFAFSKGFLQSQRLF